MKKQWLVILATVAISSLYSCRKYEEGPQVSFRDPKKLIPGEWRISSYTVDGADSMWVINGLHLQGNFHFYNYPDDREDPQLSIRIEEDSLYHYLGSWEHKKSVGKHMIDLSVFRLLSGRNFDELKIRNIDISKNPVIKYDWEIIRLKKDVDLWFGTQADGKKYVLKFIPNK
jgi:hypothetical protein